MSTAKNKLLNKVITLPVAIPANIASVILVQIRMVAAIAHMGGYDLKDDQVKSFVYLCLAGNGAKDVFKSTGINVGKKVAIAGIKRLPYEVILKINKTVGFKLLTKFGEKGSINLIKVVPLVGGVVGGTVYAVTTNTIGNIAKKVFIDNSPTINDDKEPVILNI
jgi:uncharacterized protein (DUF697 family)